MGSCTWVYGNFWPSTLAQSVGTVGERRRTTVLTCDNEDVGGNTNPHCDSGSGEFPSVLNSQDSKWESTGRHIPPALYTVESKRFSRRLQIHY